MVFKNETQRQMAVGMAKRLFDDGKSVVEVANMMCLSESKVRELKNVIDDAEKNRRRLSGEES